MTNNKIYFDHNATTQMKQSAIAAFCQIANLPLNPSSVHSMGRDAKKIMRDAKTKIQKALGAEGATIIFTSCGTEANNMILNGIKGKQGSESLAVSAIEHVSVLKLAENLGAKIIPVDENGLIKLPDLQQILESLTKPLVSIMLANNETGVVQNLSEINKVVFAAGGFIHSDASQAIGKIPFNFNDSGVDAITISGHKFGAGKGIAALIIKKGIEVQPILIGGGQEGFLRAGTENLGGVVAMAAAIEEAVNNLPDYKTKTENLAKKLVNGIKQKYPDAIFFAENSAKIPNTICFAIPNLKAESQLIKYDLAGVCVSSGSACSSGRVSASHVLLAMGVNKEIAECAIRTSFSDANTVEEVEKFLEIV